MLKLKLQYFGHLTGRADLVWKTQCWQRLRAEGEGVDREWDGWMDGTIDSMDMNLSKLQRQWKTGKPGVLQSMGLQRVGHDLVIKQQEMTMISIKGSLDESYRNMGLSSKQGKIYHSWSHPRLVEVVGVCWQRPSRGMMTVRGSYTGREVEWDKLSSPLCWTWVFTLLSADGTNLAWQHHLSWVPFYHCWVG